MLQVNLRDPHALPQFFLLMEANGVNKGQQMPFFFKASQHQGICLELCAPSRDGLTSVMGEEICNTANPLPNDFLFRNSTPCLFYIAVSITKPGKSEETFGEGRSLLYISRGSYRGSTESTQVYVSIKPKQNEPLDLCLQSPLQKPTGEVPREKPQKIFTEFEMFYQATSLTEFPYSFSRKLSRGQLILAFTNASLSKQRSEIREWRGDGPSGFSGVCTAPSPTRFLFIKRRVFLYQYKSQRIRLECGPSWSAFKCLVRFLKAQLMHLDSGHLDDVNLPAGSGVQWLEARIIWSQIPVLPLPSYVAASKFPNPSKLWFLPM